MCKGQMELIGNIGIWIGGVLLGGLIINEINERSARKERKAWNVITMALCELHEKSRKKNDELEKKLSEKEA